MKPRHGVMILALVAILGLAAAIFFHSPSAKVPVAHSQPVPGPVLKPERPVLPSQIARDVPEEVQRSGIPPHPKAAAFGTEAFTPQQEVVALLEFFQIYRRSFGAYPAGEGNAEFVNALRGNNPSKLPIFPFRHPRLDGKGNILDRWGTAYVFHAISRDRLEIRTCGPDREIFTPDDLVVPEAERAESTRR